MNNNRHSIKVSIIVPVFNRECLIHRTITSVLEQTYSNWELIIVDDGSTDNTIAVVNKYEERDKRIKLYLRDRDPKNGSTCRNIGAEKSTGKYLIFLDSDDELMPYCLDQRVDFMANNPLIDIAVFKLAFRINSGEYIEKKIDTIGDYLQDFLSYGRMPWQTMCPIWKKTFFTKIGGFNERFLRHQDPEIFIRVLLSDDLQIRVCSHLKYDALYYASQQASDKDYYQRVYKGSLIFSESITALLEEKGLSGYKPLLKGYLSYYIETVIHDNHKFNRKKYSLTRDLIKRYAACQIITKHEKQKLLLYFHFYYYGQQITCKLINIMIRVYGKIRIDKLS